MCALFLCVSLELSPSRFLSCRPLQVACGEFFRGIIWYCSPYWSVLSHWSVWLRLINLTKWTSFSDPWLLSGFLYSSLFCSPLWSPYGIGQTIIFLSCRLFFFFFFLAYSQPSQIGCLPYLHTWCGLIANLRCRSETYCMWLAENTGRKKSPSGHHRTILSGYMFATRARIDNWKKTC